MIESDLRIGLNDIQYKIVDECGVGAANSSLLSHQKYVSLVYQMSSSSAIGTRYHIRSTSDDIPRASLP